MEVSMCVIFVLLFVHQIVGPPVIPTKSTTEVDEQSKNATAHLMEMGIEYNRYLAQVVEALESDPEFRKKLETAEEADIRSGKIAQELELVSHNVRSKLDELKREELNRLRHLAWQAYDNGNDVDTDHLKIPQHVDHANPHSFEVADLHKLISKVTEDLEEADKMRRKDFKEYEMQKEFEKQEKLKQMDEEHKKEYLHKLEEQKALHEKHDPIHHPGSKQQLKEVWEKQDHMESQEFDPKAFFYMHDLDGNGVWDQDEVKILFMKELDKLYQSGAPEDDMRERAEDMERMREHVFGEMDTNKDSLISYEEFLQQTKKPAFEKDPGWETVDHQQVYTQEEYAEFEHRRQQEIERLIAEGKLQRLPPPPQGMHPPPPPAPQFQNQYPHQPQYQVPQYQGQQQYQQAQYQQPGQQQYQPQQQYQQHQQPSNNIPQQQYQQQNIPQQPQSNNIPQQQYQQNIPQQPQSNNIPQQQYQQQNIPQQQQPQSNNIPQQQYQQQNIPQQQQPLTNNLPQQQHQQQNIPQQQQPSSNNIPQQPSNNIPQVPLQNNPAAPQPPVAGAHVK